MSVKHRDRWVPEAVMDSCVLDNTPAQCSYWGEAAGVFENVRGRMSSAEPTFSKQHRTTSFEFVDLRQQRAVGTSLPA